MRNSGQGLRVMAAVEADMRPFNSVAEERAMKAWIALERFTRMSGAELRQERRALFEMQDMIARAVEAVGHE